MTVPTFEDMRTRLMPVWQNEDNKSCILWAGIFGSVARGRAQEDSDVDVVVVMKEGVTGQPVELEENLKKACARDVSCVPIWHGPDLGSWMWGHVRIEALLSSRTIYGDRRDVEHLKQEGLDVLSRAIVRYDAIAEAVRKIKVCITQAKTLEIFTLPTSQATRRDCLEALQTVLQLLDIPSLSDPTRTMVVYTAFEQADKMRTLLASQPPTSLESGDASLWTDIWLRLQPNHTAMWSWDVGCAGARKYIDHMLASARLADRFEEGGVVDESMYRDIAR